MTMRLMCVAAVLLTATSANATTMFPTTKTCPVGGEKFEYMAIGSYTTWGGLPDGMPLGTGPFPIPQPVCPSNGLVLYKDFDAKGVAALRTLVGSDEWRRQRKSETAYYLAYVIATKLGDTEVRPWLLLRATWEAKSAGATSDRARKYMSEFVDLVLASPANAKSLEAIALRARAVDALRTLGRFEEAETLRTSIAIDPAAGGSENDAAENRKGWQTFLALIAAPIARRDAARAPLDMIGSREAAYRCYDPAAATMSGPGAPLTPFEEGFCKRPEIVAEVAEVRKYRQK